MYLQYFFLLNIFVDQPQLFHQITKLHFYNKMIKMSVLMELMELRKLFIYLKKFQDQYPQM